MLTRKDFLEKWGLSKLKLNLGFLEAEFDPSDMDRVAAWDLYIELLTRVSTQVLAPDHGDEKTALNSVFSIFNTTREILKKRGSDCEEFTKLAIPVLNQIIRPFTTEWHKRSLGGDFIIDLSCQEFREALIELQKDLKNYTKALAAMACVEDLTELEANK